MNGPSALGGRRGTFMVCRTSPPIIDYQQGLLGTVYAECRDLAYPARLSFLTRHNDPRFGFNPVGLPTLSGP
jgi:hypothetical protein